jgi:mono/diheme cytochrome c family protein
MKGLALLLTAASALAAAQNLPPGKARALVAAACGECHALDVVTAARAPRARWQAVVEEMVKDGAKVTKAQIPLVVEYLARNFPAPPAK